MRTLPRVACLLALAAGLAAGAPAAGAHSGEELGGEVATASTGERAVGYGRFTTTRRHYRLHVRVCVQRWLGGKRWDTKGCAKGGAKKAKTWTQSVDVPCSRDGIYRVRVWGYTKSSSGKRGHQVSGKSPGYGIDCA